MQTKTTLIAAALALALAACSPANAWVNTAAAWCSSSGPCRSTRSNRSTPRISSRVMK